MTPASRGVLDTNAVVLLDRLDPEQLPEVPVTTAVTLAELGVGAAVAEDELERLRRFTRLTRAETDLPILPFDVQAARAFASVAASLRRAERKVAARTFDAMIAATAIANDLPLYTCNATDFAGIDGLRVIAVPHPDATNGR